MNEMSQKASEYLQKIKDKIIKTEKPSWNDYFMSMAILASSRSCDAQTKHGCVITDKKNRVLGIGYNSFPANLKDDKLPNLRPEKYKWMVHAERNALANCTIRPENGIAYITGPPCLDCAKSLYQEGIKNFVCMDGHGTHLMSEEDEIIFEILCVQGNINVEWMKNEKA